MHSTEMEIDAAEEYFTSQMVYAQRAHLRWLPQELIELISDSLAVEDMASLIRTCRTMANALNLRLYRRKVRENDYLDALTHCAMTNRVESLNMLFDARAKLENLTAVASQRAAYAAYGENLGLVTAHPLTVAAGLGHVETVQLLLDRDEEVSDSTPFTHLYTQYHALTQAIKHRHTETVRLLVDAGIDLHGRPGRNKTETIPLLLAAMKGELDMVRIIATALKNDRRLYPTRTYGSQCKYALLAAIEADSHPIVEFLLHDGFNPNCITAGPSLLYYAVIAKPPSHDRCVIVELLMLYGADTTRTDPGCIQGCWNGTFDAVKHVLVAGCTWKYRKREVRWAKCVAASAGRHDIVWLFDDYMNRRIAADEEIAR
ncbi:hypothetical protein PISL3812_07002 [Talaromyces islandicus]|uniref:F-box domain-containing protein n=1 Tax=Talaromyces islandicus TaxID=28573 RepID=A0A0U1M3J7_TALIS|nr:hypothetical protein PISL3812_07002 [Talaromyces islandicus]